MDQVYPSLLRTWKAPAWQAVHRLKFRRPRVYAGLDVPIKSSDACRLLSESEALLALTERDFGLRALSDVVNRSNQTGTRTCIVKYRRDANFAGQPTGGVVGRFFPKHGPMSFDRLSILSQHHRQRGLWDHVINRFADDGFSAQSGDLQKSCIHRNETELPFGFDSQIKNDIFDGVVDRNKMLPIFRQGLLRPYALDGIRRESRQNI